MQRDCGDKINSAQTSNGTLTILAGKCTKYETYFGEIPLLSFHIVWVKPSSYCVMNMPVFHKEIP